MELNEWITAVNDAVWGYVLIAVLVGCGLWFTWRTRFVQFRMVGEMLRLLTDSAVDTVESQVKETLDSKPSAKQTEGRRKHISSFQAFAVSVATRVGTGNLAGVATAIAVGGPGAVFWMWAIALIGSATAFVESTLAQLFKQKHKDSFIGGPAYYIQRGLHQRWMAVLFAVLITCQCRFSPPHGCRLYGAGCGDYRDERGPDSSRVQSDYARCFRHKANSWWWTGCHHDERREAWSFFQRGGRG